MKANTRNYLPALVAAAIAVLFALPVAGAPVSWVPDADGFWNVPANWSSNPALPGAADDVTINVAGVRTITHNTGTDTINTLTNAETVLILGGSTLNISSGGTNTGFLTAGGASAGTLNLNGGTLTNTGGVVTAANGGLVNQSGMIMSGGTLSTSGTGAIRASNSGANFINAVTLAGTLDLATATGIERVTGGLALSSGTINVNNNSILAFEGNQSVTGTGSIVLGATGSANRINVEAGNLTLGSGVTIRGQNGTIGNQTFVGGASTLTNNGTISADVSGGTIALAINGLTTNNGVLEAKSGGTLVLNSNIAGGAGGSINAAAGSTVLQNGISLSGAINTTGTGSFQASNSGANFFNGVALNGTLDLATSTGIERVTGGLTLAAGSAININNNSILAFEGNQTLGGTGTIVLGATGSSNRVNLEAGDLTVGAGITIRGQNGTIGNQNFASGPANLINNGRISADVATGTVTIQNNGTVTNNGILEAQSGGTLVLSSRVIGNAGSHIDAGAGSTVLQNSITISGVVNTSGSGNFTPSNSGANFFDGVAFTGNLDLATATGQEQVKNGFALNGEIKINNNSILAFEGNQTVSGNGTITLGNTGSSNRVNVEAGDLTLGANILIHGENGTIGNQNFVGGASTLTNNGRISADVAGGTIALAINGLTTNNGVLEAKSGGTLVLSSNIAGTALGSINSGAGSTVLQNGITISGIVNTTGSGRFAASNSGANFLDNVTLNGNLDLATATGQEQVKNGFALNGEIKINNNSILAFEGNQTVSGNGTITLGNTGSSNRVNVEAGNLTLGASVLIHGENGTIGNQNFVGGASTLTNNGRISADVAGGTIVLGINGLTTNNATLEAKSGGTLQLNSAITNTSGGHIDAIGAGSRVLQNGVTVSGGTLNSSGGGAFTPTNSGSNFLSNVNVAGTVDLATNTGLELIVGGLAFSGGTINVNNNSILAFEGAQSITGTGTIVLGATGSANRINLEAGSLTIGSGVTFRGQNGTFGNQNFVGGAADLTNNGTIIADVSGGVINLNTNGTLINGGTFGAANGGTLAVQRTFSGNGTVQTATGGTVSLAATSTTGRLINDANLALGANNLNISIDYNNANFGSGNSFNRRAGVTGSGQLLATGDVAQAVTGSNVTNGTTATPTLTIGNVHVGANTVNYRIANTGTTGPSLIGAIQTSVNGGNITDGRLSGTGVTASNYGPVATGANSGNLAVTFTAASAGALSPLSGQAVHIANNFDNVAGQTLSIVTGSGAAAFNLAAGNTTPSPVVFTNAHVGDTRTQVLTVTNTAPAGAFTEGLNASFGSNTGNVSNNAGTVSLLAGGASNNTNLSATLNTTAAGARSGTVTVNFVSDGSGTSGLGQTPVGSQIINVSGNVYNLASSSTIGAINFGVRHVGDGTITQNLSVTNTAPTGAFSEGLDSSFGAFTGTGGSKISTVGSLTNLAAGATNSSTMQVKLDTSTVGMVNGTLRVNQASNGTISGLANTPLSGQDPAVTADVQSSGTVVRFASPLINTSLPVNFGNVRISTVQSQALSITNNVLDDGFSESLIGSAAGTSNATVTAAGAFGKGTANPPSLAPGATDTTHIVVGIDTASAGAKSGNAILNFKSDGTGFSGGVITDLGNTNVAVQGNVYRLANPTLNTPSVTLAARVGDASPAQAVSMTNTSPDLFTEGLSVTRGATATGFTSSGSITNLAAGGTSAAAIQVALNTGAAGNFTGTQALNFVSTGAGTTGAPDLGVGTGSVSLTGKVYTPAVAQQNTPSVNFGIVHVGDVVATRAVSVTNSAPITALNDVLVAAFTGATGVFTGSGNLGTGLAAQQTNSVSLRVGLNTGTAGLFSGTATFSAASHNADLADAALPSLGVALTGQVNNFAKDAFSFGSGAGSFSRAGSIFTLDFGTRFQGSGTLTSTLFAGNSALGPADLLDGNFVFLDPRDFAEIGFNPFANLAAGENTGPLMLSFSTTGLGSFSDTIVLHGAGHNASDFSAPIGDIELMVRGTVIERGASVPEPATLPLILAGMLIFAAMQIRGRIRAR